MTTQATIIAAFEQALGKIEEVGQDLARLPEAVRVFVLVHGAQGVIDNGGYPYFFGQDWPGNPAYQEFISAYEIIGCRRQASELHKIVGTFPFPNAHLDRNRRRAFMKSNYDRATDCVRGWGDALCGDKGVWKKLARYYTTHKHDFA